MTIYTAQTKILTYWFYGNHIGFVYGLNVAVGRIVNGKPSFSSNEVYPKKKSNEGIGSYGTIHFHSDRARNRFLDLRYLGKIHPRKSVSLDSHFFLSQVPAIVSLFSLILNAVYIIFQRRLPYEIQPSSGRARARAAMLSGKVSDISTFQRLSLREPFRAVLLLPACFWVLTLTQVRPNAPHDR